MKKQFRKSLAILMAMTFIFASASFSVPMEHYAYAGTENTWLGVKLNNGELEIKTGSYETLTATLEGFPDNTTVIWKSSDTSMVTVENDGTTTGQTCKVNGVGEGTAIVTATVNYNGTEYKDECKVIVVPVNLIGPPTLSIKRGEEATLEACIDYFIGNPTVIWETSDSSVASISAEYGTQITVSALNDGTAIIKAKAVEKGIEYTDTCEVTVYTEPYIKISKSELDMTVSSEESLTVSLIGVPDDATVRWETSDPSIADLSPEIGNEITVSALSKGSATITVTAVDGETIYTATCEVTVNAAEPEPPEPPEPHKPPEPSGEPVEPGETDATPAVSGILLGKMTASGKSSLVISWNQINGANGYDVMISPCGKKGKYKLLKSVDGSTGSCTATGLKKKTAYKVIIKAFVMKNGKKSYAIASPTIHAFTSGGSKNYTNPKSVKVKKANATIKVGKTFKIKGSVKKLKKGKKLISKAHAPRLRYLSSNTKIASVSGSGKVKARAKGSCTIYVYAANGVMKTVKVTVK